MEQPIKWFGKLRAHTDKGIKYWVGQACWAGLGVVCGRALLLGQVAPFGIALCAACCLMGRFYWPMFAGALLGCIAMPGGLYRAVAIALLALVHWSCGQLGRKMPVWLGVAATGATLALSAYLLGSGLLLDRIGQGLEALLAAALVVPLVSAVSLMARFRRRTLITREEMVCFAMLVSAVLIGLGPLAIGPVSIRMILALAVILLTAVLTGASGGAGAGALMGLVLALGGQGGAQAPFLVGNLAICGLLSGCFRGWGRWGALLGLAVGNTVMTFYLNNFTAILVSYGDLAVAAGLVLLLPKATLEALRKRLNGQMKRQVEQQSTSRQLQQATVERLESFSAVFAQLSGLFDNLSGQGQVPEQVRMDQMVEAVSEQVCAGCALWSCCWKRERADTQACFAQMLGEADAAGELMEQHLPDALKRKCLRSELLLQGARDGFERYRISRQWRERLSECRALVVRQLEGVSRVMQDMAGEMDVQMEPQPETAQAIRGELDRHGIRARQVSVQRGSDGRVVVQVTRPNCRGQRSCQRIELEAVSAMVGHRMRCVSGCTADGKGGCVQTYELEQEYAVQVGVSQVRKQGGVVCGDSCCTHPLAGGKLMMAISDGMGSGERAGEESAATIALLKSLHEAGFAHDMIFSVVNQVLLFRSDEEMFATADLCLFNLVEGWMDFIKIGSAASLIKRGNHVERIQGESLPMGILEQVQPDAFRRKLRHDEMVILVSDGILESGGDPEGAWLTDLLEDSLTTDPQQLSEEILEEALMRWGGAAGDDMTVMVGKVQSQKARRENLDVPLADRKAG